MHFLFDGKMLLNIQVFEKRLQQRPIIHCLWFFVRPMIIFTSYMGLSVGVAAFGFLPFGILHKIGVAPPGLPYWWLACSSLGIIAAFCCLLSVWIYRGLKQGRIDLEWLSCFAGLILSEWVGAGVLPVGWYQY